MLWICKLMWGEFFLTILKLPTKEHDISPYLFQPSFMSFSKIL